MKKYSFRLEQVRRVRRTQEQLAKSALATANNAVTASVHVVEQRMAEYSATATAASFGAAGSGDFLRSRHFGALSSQAVVASLQAKMLAEAEANVKRAEYAEAAKKLKALDRLDERRREEYSIEYEREIEKEVNDIVVSRAARVSA